MVVVLGPSPIHACLRTSTVEMRGGRWRQGQLSRGQCGDATKPHSRIFNSLRLPASQPAPVAVAVASRGQQRERERNAHTQTTRPRPGHFAQSEKARRGGKFGEDQGGPNANAQTIFLSPKVTLCLSLSSPTRTDPDEEDHLV